MKNKTNVIKQGIEEQFSAQIHACLLIACSIPNSFSNKEILKEADRITNKILETHRKILALARSKWEKEHDTYIAYCSCGDALERTGLYPNEARYYCIGDDTTYKLVKVENE